MAQVPASELENLMKYNKIKRGWGVFDSSNEKVGDIAEVGANYLLVQKGLIFVKDVYIPKSAVADIDAGNRAVYLNTTATSIESMGWDTPPVGDAIGSDLNDTESQRVTLHEEELQAQTRREQAGEVEVRKRVVEDTRELDVPVTHDEVQVKRTRVDRDALPGEAAFTDDGETLRVPVTAETVEVTKKPRVVEEIEITKRPVTESQTVRDTVRREEADIDQEGDVLVNDGRDLVGAGADRTQRTSVDDIENLTDEGRQPRDM